MKHQTTQQSEFSRKRLLIGQYPVSGNHIPHELHFFWAGSILPDYAVDNLISFMKYRPAGWKINIWLTDPSHLWQAKYFRNINIDALPSYLIIQDIYALLRSDVFQKVATKCSNDDKNNGANKTRMIIKRELLGLGNPAAAKDLLVPLILFSYGGYYFDLDTKATKIITPPESAPYGVFLLGGGVAVSALAAEKEHILCAIAIAKIQEVYKNTQTSYGDSDKIKYQCHFFNTEMLRRKSLTRAAITVKTSGAVLKLACHDFILKGQLEQQRSDGRSFKEKEIKRFKDDMDNIVKTMDAFEEDMMKLEEQMVEFTRGRLEPEKRAMKLEEDIGNLELLVGQSILEGNQMQLEEEIKRFLVDMPELGVELMRSLEEPRFVAPIMECYQAVELGLQQIIAMNRRITRLEIKIAKMALDKAVSSLMQEINFPYLPGQGEVLEMGILLHKEAPIAADWKDPKKPTSFEMEDIGFFDKPRAAM